MKKKILWGIVVLLIGIQFFRPERNVGEAYGANDISKTVEVPADVQAILERSCYDCHSNNTVYPWYTNVQPVGWWLAHNVDEGNGELNFSEFNTYKLKRKLHKFEEIAEQVKEGEMPLTPYTFMHGNAKLSQEDQEKLVTWALNSKALLDTVKIAETDK